MDPLKIEHMRVLDAMNVTNSNGGHMDFDDPRIPDLLKKGWRLTGAYAAQYLENNPKPSKHDLETMFADFPSKLKDAESGYTFEGSAVEIGPSIYVVAASYGLFFRTGTFMVVARNREGHFQELWNIKDLAAKHYPQRDEIGRWVHLVRHAYYNGPLVVEKVLPVFPAANGHARFMVDAYQAADGGTHLKQLSIWEWDDAKARPLLVDVYHDTSDWREFRFDGRTIRIVTKEEEQLQTLFSCGTCPEPQGVWTVRIIPDGVKNFGHHFLKPEYQWADELLTRFRNGADTTSLASPGMIESWKAQINHLQALWAKWHVAPVKTNKFSWGMMNYCRVLRRGKTGAFVLITDEGKLRFSYELRNGRPYFTAVKITPPGELTSSLSKKPRLKAGTGQPPKRQGEFTRNKIMTSQMTRLYNSEL